MPVTRSKASPTRQQAEEESTGTTTGTSGNTETTQTSERTTETEATSAGTLRTVTGGEAAGAAADKTTKKAPSRTGSVKSTRTRKEIQARVELARRELVEAQAAAALARQELELLRVDSDEEDSDVEGPRWNDNVTSWVQSTAARLPGKGHEEQRVVDIEHRGEASGKGRTDQLQAAPAAATKKEPRASDGASQLAEAILQAIGSKGSTSVTGELPFFDGNPNEWIAFRTTYEESAPSYTNVQNMGRLRKFIKGTAREAVKSLLFAECSPDEVMDALRRRFGRPDTLILLELDKVKSLSKISESSKDVCTLASQVNNTVATIRGLKRPQYLHSPEMVKTIVDKMPAVLRYRWFDFAADREEEDPDLVLLAKFLNREADRCGPYAGQEVTIKKQPPEPAIKRQPPRQYAHAAIEGEHDQCPHCGGEHRLTSCRKFLQVPPKERWEIAKAARVCFRCLSGRHRKETCRRPPCKSCGRWHHSLLHEDRREDPKPETQKEVTNNVRPVNAVRTTKAYLKMAPVEVYGPKGAATILALLDEGSTVSLLDAAVASQVGLEGPKDTLTLETVGGKMITKNDSMIVNMKVRGIHQSKKRSIKGVRTIDNINLTPQRLELNKIKGCAHLSRMADQLYYDEESPKLLIGQDNWELIVSRSTRKGKRNQPVASLTYLGWVLHGSEGVSSQPVNFVNACAHVREEELEKLMKDHFAIESLGVQPRRPSNDVEVRALDLLSRNTRRLDNGRFETGLIWRDEEQTMPNNYSQAESRLRNIEKKLDKDASLKEDYSKQMQHLFDSGYAERVQHGSTSKRLWYLPHFAVSHPTKSKKRIVFDAAARFGGKSLNDVLLPGPDLLQSLFGVLLRFRQHPYAVVADIKEMFLQIRIREEDRDSLRFLWRGDRRTGAPDEYRMTSVIFGAACSPSAAIYVKNRNAAEYQEEYPTAARAIERNHYMDDYLHSFESIDEAIKVAKEVDFIHRQAGFELRGWASNTEEILRELTDEANNEEIELGTKEEKTLGLRWFTGKDELSFRSCPRNVRAEVVDGQKTPTKREVTSAVMSTFDPLGLASPVLIQGKKLIQSIWRSGVDWDDRIIPEDEQVWLTYLNDLQLLRDLRIPRCVAQSSTEGELHVFTDASEKAYACAVYLRQRALGEHRVRLLAGKARVTPLRTVSIPRLELQAALLGTRLLHTIECEMDIKVTRKVYWTDSSTVLSWIKSDPRSFKPFVAHRLAEIEDTTRPQEWRWVPTGQNPADDATRDIPKDFNGDHRWFNGPAFLQKDEDQWPQPRTFKAEPTGEEKSSVAMVRVSCQYPTPDPARFSSWDRLVRATARVLQFIELCRAGRRRVNVARDKKDPTWRRFKKRSKESSRPTQYRIVDRKLLPLEPSLIESAETLLLRRCQAESFKEEIKCIEKGKPVDKSSKLKRLDVVSGGGLLRLSGRIGAAAGFGEGYKRPVLLDSSHHITRLIIAHYHEAFNHGNHATVINELRQRFWILGLRSAVRSAVHRCQWCRVYRGGPQVPPAGNLPQERLRHGEPPFTCTAVDYFGPMSVTVGRRHEKRWGVLFTCLTTRAVHVELAATLSTDSMILALRRMAARRGMPRTIFSDNGTNFVGANKELQDALREMKNEDILNEANDLKIRWKFIPPGAPNMGGAWERMVRSIKTALAVTLKERHPKEEVLHTLLLEAEHIVNSRPLVETDNEEEALTPNHFLIGRSCGSSKIGVFNDEDLTGKRSWRTAQRLADHFWRRWVKEYLPTLIPRRTGATTGERDLQCGDTVLIVDSTLPRCTWPRGEVVQTFPGPDGRTRIVEVRTSGGVLKRPSSKLVLLVPAHRSEAPVIEQRDESSVITKNNEPAIIEPDNEHRVADPGVGAAHEGEDVGDRT